METRNKPLVIHVSEVLATGVLEFIYSLVSEIKDYDHAIIYRIRELGHDDESVRKLFPSNVKLYKWHHVDRPINLINDSKAAKELYKLLKTNKPDVLHLHSSKAGALGRIVAPFVMNEKAVLYTPNGAPFARTDISKNKKILFRYSEKIANKLAGQVISVSASEAKLYQKVGIESNYINNGVNIQNENLVHNNSFDKKSKFRIVTSGRITRQKNPNSFNRIAEQFVGNDRVEFIWIGAGPPKFELKSPNITVTGWVEKHKVKDYLQNASLYLSTALWEGLPFSVLEAMSMGLPVVISKCTGNIDLVEHTKSGFFFENEEDCIKYIQKFLDQPSLINELGLKARERCNGMFTKKQMCLKYKTIYDKILLE